MSIQAAWNSMVRSAAVLGGMKKIPDITGDGPTDDEVKKAVAEQREKFKRGEGLPEQRYMTEEGEILTESQLAARKARDAAAEADAQPKNTMKEVLEGIIANRNKIILGNIAKGKQEGKE